jgi:hypothetical protein
MWGLTDYLEPRTRCGLRDYRALVDGIFLKDKVEIYPRRIL